MEKSLSFLLSNSGDKIANDTYFPEGTSLVLSENTFQIRINPNSDFWRYGIRISKSPYIKTNPETRLKESKENEKYIHLSAGEFEKSREWKFESLLQLVQYNFEEMEHILYRNDNYIPHSTIYISIEYIRPLENLRIGIANSYFDYIFDFPLNSEYKYFKIFAWADKHQYSIDSTINIRSYFSEYNIDAFKVNKILFRYGSIFDPSPINQSDLAVLPVSTQGTVTSNIRNKIAEIGIPLPTEGKVGEIKVTELENSAQINSIAYAYSVDNNKASTIKHIEKICNNLIQLSPTEYKILSLPLLGTGAGEISVEKVGIVYDKTFNSVSNKKQIIVSILTREHFDILMQLFIGQAELVNSENIELKPKRVLDLENEINIRLTSKNYEVNKKNEIIKLSLSGIKLKELKIISLIKTLTSLEITKSEIFDIEPLKDNKSLSYLDLSYNRIEDIGPISNLKNLAILKLRKNLIQNILPIQGLSKLVYLDISQNSIFDISPLKQNANLYYLDVSENEIEIIEPLKNLKSIERLILSKNRILDIYIIWNLPKLEFLQANSNKFDFVNEIILAENENHLSSIRNFLLKEQEENKIEIQLPKKILLLGNHSSGKSSLLYYLLHNNNSGNPDSTHILNVKQYPADATELPQAVFFDFGGQDYYHGFYRTFMSSDSIYIIIWRGKNNLNKQRVDRSGVQTQDFSLNYWLYQKEYIENEKYNGKSDPLILIQSHSDKEAKTYFNLIEHQIENDFYVAFTKVDDEDTEKINQNALRHLKSYIEYLIKKNRSTIKQPTWYYKFLLYIISENKSENYSHKSIEDIMTHYQRSGKNQAEYLKDDLDQLHKNGLVIYFKNENFSDVAWLNPSKLAEHVHNKILNKSTIGSYKGRVPEEELKKFDSKIIELLCHQKVIFKHQYGENGIEYITPNFLPLSNEDRNFDLFKFGLNGPLFTLKFENFIPFGLINQAICFFGQLKDYKKFWRDQLLFTIENKAKILITIDFEKLEIKAFASFNKETTEIDKKYIIKFLFYGTVGLYWDLELFNYSEFVSVLKSELKKEDYENDEIIYQKFEGFENIYNREQCWPKDLYISVDEKYYASYYDLCANNSDSKINVKTFENDKFQDSRVLVDIYKFAHFINKRINRRKKVVLSYSKKDLELVNKFRDYLVPLYDDGLIDHPWYCSELIAGSEWNEEIQRRFDESDIIFFMISENLMATPYVKEFEIKKSIDRWKNDNSILIVPVILQPYHWQRKGEYNLSEFTAIPYTAKAVTTFKNQRTAWHIISESIRIMLTKDDIDGDSLTKEIEKIQEKIMNDEA